MTCEQAHEEERSSYDTTNTYPHHLPLLRRRLRALHCRGKWAGGGTGVHAGAPGQRRGALAKRLVESGQENGVDHPGRELREKDGRGRNYGEIN